MTLEEAIIHAEAVAKTKEREAKENRNHGGWAYADEATKCSACAAEHRQLAEWLKELKARREKDGRLDDTISDVAYILDTLMAYRNIVDCCNTQRILDAISILPSAQPEIIFCKNCKWSDWYYADDGYRYYYCNETGASGRTADDFCSYAERRTDEQVN